MSRKACLFRDLNSEDTMSIEKAKIRLVPECTERNPDSLERKTNKLGKGR